MLIFALSSSHSSTLSQLLFETVFDVYIVILLFLCLLMQIYYNETRKKLRAYQAAILSFMEQGGNVQINLSNGAGEHALGVGINSSPSANLNHPVHNQLLPPLPTPLSAWRLKMLPFSYAAVSAIIGTQSVLLAKATSDLLRTSVTGDQQFTQGFTWVILVGWASTIVFWLYRMDTALRKFDGPFIVPVLQVVWTLFSIIGGGIFYKEFNKMTSLAIGLFTLGVAVMMSGVYLLAPQPHPSHSGGGGGGQGGVEMQQVHQMRIAAQQMADMEAGLHSGNSPYDNGMRKESTGSGNSSGNSLGQISVSPIYGGHGKDDKPMASLSIPPTKVTRVTSTGRMVIQSDDRPLSRGDVYVEMSPEFGSYKSAIDQPVRQAVSASTTAKMTSSSSNPNNAGRLKGGPGSRYQSNAESQSESLISPSSPTADNEDPASQADEKTRSSSVDEMILPMQLQSASSSSSSSYAAAMEKPGLKSGGSTPMPPHHASNATTHHNQHPYAAHPPKRTLRPYHSSSDAHPSHPPLARGILGEAGLLDGVGVTTTPPMRPAVHWGTPDRPATSESLRDYSRPTSASGSHMLHHHSNESGANSIPPSPALTGFDPNHYGGATKRSRAFSLGFSIPMVELGESP